MCMMQLRLCGAVGIRGHMLASGCECQQVGCASALAQLTGLVTVTCTWTVLCLPACIITRMLVSMLLTSCLTVMPVHCLQNEDMDALRRPHHDVLLASTEEPTIPAPATTTEAPVNTTEAPAATTTEAPAAATEAPVAATEDEVGPATKSTLSRSRTLHVPWLTEVLLGHPA